MGIFNLFKRQPDADTLFSNNVQAAKHKLEEIKDSTTDMQAKCSISNAIMMLDSVNDRFTSYTPDQINEIFAFITSIISEVNIAAEGNVAFDGNAIKTMSLKSSISQYVSLISYFVSNYVIKGSASSLDTPKKLFQAVKGRMVNEKLDVQIEQKNKECIAKEKEIDDIDDKMTKILARVKTGTCSQSQIDALKREYNMLEHKKNSCVMEKNSLSEAIDALATQIKQNKMHQNLLDGYDLYEELSRSRTYNSIDDFAAAAEKLKIAKEEKRMEKEAMDDIYKSTQTYTEPNTSNAFAAAEKEGQMNKVKLTNQAQDDENFSVPTNNRDVDNF